MRFHGNQVSWGINYSFISVYSKYQPTSFICSSIVLAPVISSLEEIYCMKKKGKILTIHDKSGDFSSIHAKITRVH